MNDSPFPATWADIGTVRLALIIDALDYMGAGPPLTDPDENESDDD